MDSHVHAAQALITYSIARLQAPHAEHHATVELLSSKGSQVGHDMLEMQSRLQDDSPAVVICDPGQQRKINENSRLTCEKVVAEIKPVRCLEAL